MGNTGKGSMPDFSLRHGGLSAAPWKRESNPFSLASPPPSGWPARPKAGAGYDRADVGSFLAPLTQLGCSRSRPPCTWDR